MRYSCPCCGYLTFREPLGEGSYNICPVCYWEDDPVRYKNENYEGGANRLSLVGARKNYITFGAIEKDLVKYTRKPREDEKKSL